MAFKEVASLDAETTTPLGGFNKKTKKDNPASAEGYYLGTKVVESKKSKNGKASIHILQTKKGNLGIWGKTDMDRKMQAVTPGSMVRISFAKMQPTPNGEMYIYRVEVDADNTINVSGLASNSTNEETDAFENDNNAYADEAVDEEEELDEAMDEVEEPEALTARPAMSAAQRKQSVEALLSKKRTATR